MPWREPFSRQNAGATQGAFSKNPPHSAWFLTGAGCRASGCGCGVFEAQLHCLAAAPCVDIEPPGQMEPRAAMVFKRSAKGAVKRTERDCIELRAGAIAET